MPLDPSGPPGDESSRPSEESRPPANVLSAVADTVQEERGSLPLPGDIFDGKYRIERAIGRGAMAVVYEATHLKLEDRVAIKLLLPQWAAEQEFVERFMREGRAATRIRSEHVVRVFDVGIAGAHPFLVMEYLAGNDLDQVLAQSGPLEVSVAVDHLLQACEAIAEAHVRGIVHRDLKPANLFLTRRADGSACVKVLDFGISKAPGSLKLDTRATAPATMMGSPHYMSPEQMMSAADVDARADVWALGAILHEFIVGAPPFDGETMAAISAKVLRDPPPKLRSLRAEVPAGVEAAVLRCLEREPERRFANVAELAAALVEFGSASARSSAERIARVLDGGTGKISMPIKPRGEERSEGLSAMLARSTIPPHPRGRVVGYVVLAIAFVGVAIGVVAMVTRNEHAVRAAEEREAAEHAAAAASAVASAAAGVNAVPTSPASSAVTATPSPPPPVAAHNPSPAAAAASVASAPRLTEPKHASPAAHPPTHARGPRHGQHPTPTPTTTGVPPLPDFPVPSDPMGEPASRPIAAPPPATPPSAATPSPVPAPPPSNP
jgi:serine/threonine protein kinase